MKKIAVIGGGWYGCHIARELRLTGHDVTLFESENDIFSGISGEFGIRLHAGPHYPRSEKTRKSCRDGFNAFIKTYPELIIHHAFSIYGLGVADANNEPPKIDISTFRTVGNEVPNSREIVPSKWGYRNLQTAFDINEPSILLGEPLRKKFREYLEKIGVKIICKFKVKHLLKQEEKTVVSNETYDESFDYVVNTTSYKDLLPPPEKPLPFELDIVYQPCLALVYEDLLSNLNALPPFSFIVMDGWFPCIMPYITDINEHNVTDRKYIVTHGKYTIMGSYKTRAEADHCLSQINDEFVKNNLQPHCEHEMEKFWPFFSTRISDSKRRFNYIGWKGAVLAKVKTNREFRSAVTLEKDGVIYVIPGKVSNIFDAANETISIINSQNLLNQNGYRYVKGGVLDDAIAEIIEPIDNKIRNTCNLQTYSEITNRLETEKKAMDQVKPESAKTSACAEIYLPWLSRKGIVYKKPLPPKNSELPLSFLNKQKSNDNKQITKLEDYTCHIISSL